MQTLYILTAKSTSVKVGALIDMTKKSSLGEK